MQVLKYWEVLQTIDLEICQKHHIIPRTPGQAFLAPLQGASLEGQAPQG
jgi:hypothetical protein